jgi:hypothetical protein
MFSRCSHRPGNALRGRSFLHCILRILYVLLLQAALIACALEPERTDQENCITRAVYADGRLWLLTEAGTLSSIAEGNSRRIGETLAELALDLCTQNGQPVVLTCKREGCDAWTLRRREQGRWSTQATIPARGDAWAGLSCTDSSATLVSRSRVIRRTASDNVETILSEPLPPGVVTSIFATPDSVFVGINAGEWGGGLRRIDLKTGSVEKIERNASGDLCGGPLNTACDPVNGIAAALWNPRCIVAAIGLVHFAPHGRIVEVCGDEVRRLYFKPYSDAKSDARTGDGDEPFRTAAFFGLARSGDDLWAAATDGVYRIDAKAVVHPMPLPAFHASGGIYVSFALPQVVLVLTDIYSRQAVGGRAPMIVPR